MVIERKHHRLRKLVNLLCCLLNRKENRMSEKNIAFGDFVAGFLLGGLVGAATAILMAPRSGEETRAQIRAKGVELRDSAEQTVDEALASVKSTAREVSGRAEELRAQSQAVLEEAQKQWAEAVEEITKVSVDAIEEMRTTAAKAAEETKAAAVETK